MAEMARLPPLVTSWEVENLRERARARPRAARRSCCKAATAPRASTTAAREPIADEAEDPAADEPRARARHAQAGRPHRPHRRPVREAALGRHRDARRRHAARATAATSSTAPSSPPRIASPIRRCMLARTSAPALTLNFIRALIDGGFADLHHPEYWDCARSRRTRRTRTQYQHIVDSIGESLDFVERDRGRRGRRAAPRRLLHEPRSARAALRAGADAPGAAPARLVQPVDALPVDRHAHRAARRRARRVLPRHPQPARHQDRPGDDARLAASACSTCSIPSDEPGRHHADPPHGRRQGRRRSCRRSSRPSARAGRTRAVGLRSDARQHRDHAAGHQDAPVRQHPSASSSRASSSTRSSARASAACTSSSPARTSPSASAARAASPRPTSSARTRRRVDPRLNYEQALEWRCGSAPPPAMSDEP